jgi:hypothetical protein
MGISPTLEEYSKDQNALKPDSLQAADDVKHMLSEDQHAANNNDQRTKELRKRNLSIRVLNLNDDSDEEEPQPQPPSIPPLLTQSPRDIFSPRPPIESPRRSHVYVRGNTPSPTDKNRGGDEIKGEAEELKTVFDMSQSGKAANVDSYRNDTSIADAVSSTLRCVCLCFCLCICVSRYECIYIDMNVVLM